MNPVFRSITPVLSILLLATLILPADVRGDGDREAALNALRRLPLSFEPSRKAGAAGFVARAVRHRVLIGESGLQLLGPSGQGVTLRWIGRLDGKSWTPLEPLQARSHYYHGADLAHWRTSVPHFGKVRQSEVFEGVDVVYYGNAGRLEFDFVLSANSDPSHIAFQVDGANGLAVEDDGDLLIRGPLGEVRSRRPVAYQERDGERQRVEVAYRLSEDGHVSFELGEFDHDQALVIDPVIEYGSYLAGEDDDGAVAVAVGPDGSAYVTGFAEFSEDAQQFPTTPGSFQPEHSGLITNDTGEQGELDPELDVFVLKISPDGSQLVYSTFLGGEDRDVGNSIAIDADGNAYVCGETVSQLFPVSRNPYLRRLPFGRRASFAAKLSADGSELLYSTFLGGMDLDLANGIAVDSQGQAVVAGMTTSLNFPLTPGSVGALRRGRREAFVLKLLPDGSDVVFSTILSGSMDETGYDVAVDANDSIFVTGSTNSTNFPTTAGAFQTALAGGMDAFVAKLSSGGDALEYSTLLGGEADDGAEAIFVRADGSATIAGTTESPDLPVGEMAFSSDYSGNGDALAATIAADGSAASCTYLGGSGRDEGRGVAVTAEGDIVIGGNTESDDFPVTQDATQSDLRSNTGDAFYSRISGAGELVASTYYGSSNEDEGRDIALGPDGGVFLVGVSSWEPAPRRALATRGSIQRRGIDDFEGYIVKFEGVQIAPTPDFSSVSAAAFVRGAAVAPQSHVSGFGVDLAPRTESATSLPLPTELAGVSVLVIDSAGAERLAELVFVASLQINYLIPAGTASGEATVRVIRDGDVVAEGTVVIAVAAPSLFTANADGKGVAAASFVTARGDGRRESGFAFSNTPAGSRVPVPIDLGAEGDVTVIVLFGTGFRDASEVTARVGGRTVTVAFAGEQPEFRGLDQANLILDRALIGAGEVEVVLEADGVAANVVVISIL